jgi:hypothetical protein
MLDRIRQGANLVVDGWMDSGVVAEALSEQERVKEKKKKKKKKKK